METILTFDVGYAEILRRELLRSGYREGTDFRIGMAEERHRMTLRAPNDAWRRTLKLEAEAILANIRVTAGRAIYVG